MDLQDEECSGDVLFGHDSKKLVVEHTRAVVNGPGDNTGLGAGVNLAGIIRGGSSRKRGEEQCRAGEEGGNLHGRRMGSWVGGR